MNWIKTHKFWTIVVVLFLYGVTTAIFLGSDPAPVGGFIALYIIVGYPLKWVYGKIRERLHRVAREVDNANKQR